MSRNGTPANGPAGISPTAAARASAYIGVMTALSAGFSRFDPFDGRLDQFARLDGPLAHQRGLRGRVEVSNVVT